MPRPKRGEKRNEFVGRAIPILKKEGLTQKQAVGKSEGMYTYYRKKGRKK